MQAISHSIIYFYKLLRDGYSIKEAEEIFEHDIALLLLPDAINLYVPRNISHFEEHPVTKKISVIQLNTTPNNLVDIEQNIGYFEQKHIPQSVIAEKSNLDMFIIINPLWKKTAYYKHLAQDDTWDNFIKILVDVSGRFHDKFIYRKPKKTVNGTTFRKDLQQLDNAFFLETSKRIFDEYRIKIDNAWFEKHVKEVLFSQYSQELADNTWQFIKLPENAVIPKLACKENINYIINKFLKN